MEIIGADGRRHEYPLGPQRPRLRPCDVELRHKVWLENHSRPTLRRTTSLRCRGGKPLEELKRSLNSEDREALLDPIPYRDPG